MKIHAFIFLLFSILNSGIGQALRIPQNKNFRCKIARELGVCEIEIKYNAPAVNGREGKIWGTDVAWFGTKVLGYGSNVRSPWRAGADEATVISFSTPVFINGRPLPAGEYSLFMELASDSTTIIFNKNTRIWGTYFYDKDLDVLRVRTANETKNEKSIERLEYQFRHQTENSVEVVLLWERWAIPFTLSIDAKSTTLAYIQREMSSELGFDPPSLIAAAGWCLENNLNLQQAYEWASNAVNPSLGASENFNSLMLLAELASKLSNETDAINHRRKALEIGSIFDLHRYGRQLLAEKKEEEAKKIFETNYQRNRGAWPSTAGMMRLHALNGDFKKAIEFAELALEQAPDELNKKAIEGAIVRLKEGKAL